MSSDNIDSDFRAFDYCLRDGKPKRFFILRCRYSQRFVRANISITGRAVFEKYLHQHLEIVFDLELCEFLLDRVASPSNEEIEVFERNVHAKLTSIFEEEVDVFLYDITTQI